jgi:hypothetical protein
VVEFHVTSLDVIHSFYAYKLGVKADANPGVDNVAYTKPPATLCGRVRSPGGRGLQTRSARTTIRVRDRLLCGLPASPRRTAVVCARSSRELITQREPMRRASWILLIRGVPDFRCRPTSAIKSTRYVRQQGPPTYCFDAFGRGHYGKFAAWPAY